MYYKANLSCIVVKENKKETKKVERKNALKKKQNVERSIKKLIRYKIFICFIPKKYIYWDF